MPLHLHMFIYMIFSWGWRWSLSGSNSGHAEFLNVASHFLPQLNQCENILNGFCLILSRMYSKSLLLVFCTFYTNIPFLILKWMRRIKMFCLGLPFRTWDQNTVFWTLTLAFINIYSTFELVLPFHSVKKSTRVLCFKPKLSPESSQIQG